MRLDSLWKIAGCFQKGACYVFINFRDEFFIPSAIAVLAMLSFYQSPGFFVTWTAHNDDLERGLCCNGHSYALGLCFAAVYNDIVIFDFC